MALNIRCRLRVPIGLPIGVVNTNPASLQRSPAASRSSSCRVRCTRKDAATTLGSVIVRRLRLVFGLASPRLVPTVPSRRFTSSSSAASRCRIDSSTAASHVILQDVQLRLGAALRKPFGPHLAMGALSSAVPSWGLQVHLGCVRLSPACPCRYLHTCHLRPARHYPRLWIRPPSSGGRRDLNPPDQCAAWRTLLPHPTSSFRTSSDTESSFPLRPRSDCWGRMKTSQVPTKDVRTCMGSSTPWRPPSPHRGGDVGVAFDGAHSLGAPDDGSFRCSIAPPVRAPVNASPAASQRPAHDSG